MPRSMKFTDEELRTRIVDAWNGSEMLCLCCGSSMAKEGPVKRIEHNGDQISISYLNDQIWISCSGCDQSEYFGTDGYHGSSIGARLYPYDSQMRPAMFREMVRWCLIEWAAGANKRVVLGMIPRAERDLDVEKWRQQIASARPRNWLVRAIHHTRRYFGQTPKMREREAVG